MTKQLTRKKSRAKSKLSAIGLKPPPVRVPASGPKKGIANEARNGHSPNALKLASNPLSSRPKRPYG